MNQPRVVITASSMLTSLGDDKNKSFSQALCGRSYSQDYSKYAAEKWPNLECFEQKIALCDRFNTEEYVANKDARRTERFIVLSLCAAEQMWKESGYEDSLSDAEGNGVGVLFGVGVSGLDKILESQDILESKGARRVSPFMIPASIGNLAAGQVAIRFNLRGPNWGPASMGTSSAVAIGEGLQHIKEGRCHSVVAGGTESSFNPLMQGALNNKGLLSKNNGGGVRQLFSVYSKESDGYILGEGASALLLEDLAHAEQRGAQIQAEILGYASLINPESPWKINKKSLLQCIDKALADAEIELSELDLILAEGTGDRLNDQNELAAYQELILQHPEIKVSCCKAFSGHIIGASAAVDMVFGLKILEQQKIPVLELKTPLEGAENILVTDENASEIKTILSFNFGLGGNYAVTIFRKWS